MQLTDLINEYWRNSHRQRLRKTLGDNRAHRNRNRHHHDHSNSRCKQSNRHC